MKKIIIILMLISTHGIAQDTIRVGDQFRNFKLLEMGTTKDVIYSELAGKLRSVSIKTKTTELVEIDNRTLLKITHKWQSNNEELSGYFEYFCEPKTLKPIQHTRHYNRVGKEAFQFFDSKIVGLDSATENKQKDFELKLEQPTYNWEVDLETYSLITMKMGHETIMRFYHPGSKSSPKDISLKVIADENIKLPNGKILNCWIVHTDYGGTQPTKFWYTKKSQNFVKMEGEYKDLKIRKERIF